MYLPETGESDLGVGYLGDVLGIAVKWQYASVMVCES